MSRFSEATTETNQGSYRRWTISLGRNAGATFVEEILQLCHWQVIDRTLTESSNQSLGWLTVWGWQATLASVYYLAGAQIQGLITLTNPDYSSHPWQTVLLFWASMVFTIFMNTIVGKFLPKFEGSILIIHILGFFAILLPLVILGSHQDASEVFGTFLNTGNWPTQGLSFMIGLIGSVYTFTGTQYLQSVQILGCI